jgi:hypothetical protein
MMQTEIDQVGCHASTILPADGSTHNGLSPATQNEQVVSCAITTSTHEGSIVPGQSAVVQTGNDQDGCHTITLLPEDGSRVHTHQKDEVVSCSSTSLKSFIDLVTVPTRTYRGVSKRKK